MPMQATANSALDIELFFAPTELVGTQLLLDGTQCVRRELTLDNGDSALLDSFPGETDARCCFLRLSQGPARTVRFVLRGTYRVLAGASGGWLLAPTEADQAAYWIPQPPVLRRQDTLGHVLAERPVSLAGLNASPATLAVDLRLPADWHLDWVVWRFGPEAAPLAAELEQPSSLEKQAWFLWGSKVNFTLPAGVYQYLLHGQVYTNDFVWPRNWKFHSELDAHGLYLALDGLHLTTGKTLYGLMKRQMLYSVISAQAEDGGWYQGEWTDLMESHYRLHNAAMLMLAAGLEEFGDETIRAALTKAAAFLVKCTDRTDIGQWFLHDSLENSAEAMEEMRRQTNTPWIPSRTLGKSPTNKLILNTHLDAIVALERYRDATGDNQYAGLINSARGAAQALLALRPAEILYRLIYKAIELTLLPKDQAMALPLHLRLLKRLTWMYLTPRMHGVKRLFPRIVMPGGLIERHIAPMHYDINYHPVNVMDLARFQRRFPDEPLGGVIAGAVRAVTGSGLLRYWSEAANRRFAVVEWADALYQLCTLRQDMALRRHLAETLLLVCDLGLGLPPALLGGDAEVNRHGHRVPSCPIPLDPRLLVANLSLGGHAEFLVINPTCNDLTLDFAQPGTQQAAWVDAQGLKIPASGSILVRQRSWILGKASA